MIHDNSLLDALLFIAILIPAVILHEVAHGLVAQRLGDPTAKEAGRLTLNPIRHIDPFGSILLPTFLALARQNVFGWAKPVPVNPNRFQRPVSGMAITALAGPATNLTLALVIGQFAPLIEVDGEIFRTSDGLLGNIVIGALVVNVALAVFNMLPIPPLDGSRLLPLVLGPGGRRLYDQAAQYGFLVLILLLFVFPGSLSFLATIIEWVIRVAV